MALLRFETFVTNLTRNLRVVTMVISQNGQNRFLDISDILDIEILRLIRFSALELPPNVATALFHNHPPLLA